MSSTKISFSVIIPLFNKGRCVGKTLNSVLRQSFEDFEVIIINDGSTDNSLKVAQSFAAKDPRFLVYNKSNGGASSARNFGIAKARCHFLAFLDADDLWDESYLLKMSDLILKFPDCGMYGCASKLRKRFRVIYTSKNIPEGIIEDYFKTMLRIKISWTSATIVKKDVFSKVGMFPIGMFSGEDSFMWTKIAISYKMAFTPETLSSYNVFLGQALSAIKKKDNCRESWLELYDENKFYLNEYIAKKAIQNGIRHVLGNHRNVSLEIERQFLYTKLFKQSWNHLYFLNRLPKLLVSIILVYKRIKNFYYITFSGNI